MVDNILSNVVDVDDVLIFIVHELYPRSYDLPFLPLFDAIPPEFIGIDVPKNEEIKLSPAKNHLQTHLD
jgi:hypothetical protein